MWFKRAAYKAILIIVVKILTKYQISLIMPLIKNN